MYVQHPLPITGASPGGLASGPDGVAGSFELFHGASDLCHGGSERKFKGGWVEEGEVR